MEKIVIKVDKFPEPKFKFKSTWDIKNLNPRDVRVASDTQLEFTHCWSWAKDETTEAFDLKVKTQRDMTLEDALCFVEEKMLESLKKLGANEIRHYFIEAIFISDWRIKFEWGT